MSGSERSWLPWRGGGRVAVAERSLQVQRRQELIPVGPQAVTRAREAVERHMADSHSIPSGSAFSDAVVLAVSELAANTVRHAADSPVMVVATTVGARQLVVAIGDTDPRLPDLTSVGMGAGLEVVAELAAEYDGDLSAEPAADLGGKVMLVRFRIPSRTQP